MDTTETLIPGTPVAIMADEKVKDTCMDVLPRLQQDIEKTAKEKGATPSDVLFAVWTTLGRVLTASGANPGALIATFIATHPEIVAAHMDEDDAMREMDTSIFKTPRSDSIN